MSQTDDVKHRARYTLEFKLEAVRLVKAGQEMSVTARGLNIPKATLGNWHDWRARANCRASVIERSVPSRWSWPGCVPSSARVKMARDILEKATAYFAKISL